MLPKPIHRRLLDVRHTASVKDGLAAVAIFLCAAGFSFALVSGRCRATSAQLENKPDLEAVAARLRDRKFIFCISPGRAGTKFLASVLNCSPDVLAQHEPEPRLNGEVLQNALLQGGTNHTASEWFYAKWDRIAKSLDGSSPNLIYAETSHMFAKTLAQRLPSEDGHKLLEQIGGVTVVFLRRNITDTILSQARLGWFQPNHSGINNWYYPPSAVRPSVRVVPQGLAEQDNIARLVGYNLDVELRGQAITSNLQSIAGSKVLIVEQRLEELSSTDAVARFLTHTLGLTLDRWKLEQLHKIDANARSYKKDQRSIRITEHTVRSSITQAREVCRRAGIDLPLNWN